MSRASVKKIKKKKQKEDDDESELKKLSETSLSIRSECSFHLDARDSCLIHHDPEPDRSGQKYAFGSQLEESSESLIDEEEDISLKSSQEIWKHIMEEYEDSRKVYERAREFSKPYEPTLPETINQSFNDYLHQNIYPVLLPILEEVLQKAKEWDCLKIQKCSFNGIDYMTELLYNRNPLHPERQNDYLQVFDIPFVKSFLADNPRPPFPKSWLWSEEDAVCVIQAYIRRYLVCKEEKCQEMRTFWKVIKEDRPAGTTKKDEKCRITTYNRITILIEECLDEVIRRTTKPFVQKKCHHLKPCKCVLNDTVV